MYSYYYYYEIEDKESVLQKKVSKDFLLVSYRYYLTY